jgi:hypothetical protein
MRHTELWARLEGELGSAYAHAWAGQHVMAALDGRTVQEALEAGVAPKAVWRAVAETLSLPESQR